MTTSKPHLTSFTPRRLAWLAAAAVTVVALAACGLAMAAGRDIARPAPAEFGMGPRTSSNGRYVVTLETDGALRRGKLQTIRAAIRDAEGHPIVEAGIAIDGGMPQHGHGLPTRPRVSRELGDGRYEIAGVRFNMGGWWEFRLTITGPAGSDVVTFNLDL